MKQEMSLGCGGEGSGRGGVLQPTGSNNASMHAAVPETHARSTIMHGQSLNDQTHGDSM